MAPDEARPGDARPEPEPTRLPGYFGSSPWPNRRRAIGCLGLLVVLALALLIERRGPAGVTVEVVNAGQEPMLALQVLVTGRTYELGDLAAGQEASVQVEPTGDTNVRLRFVDGEGVQRELAVDCQFGYSGFRGTIRASVADGEVKDVEDGISIGWP